MAKASSRGLSTKGILRSVFGSLFASLSFFMHFDQLLDTILSLLSSSSFARYFDTSNSILLARSTCTKRLLWDKYLRARLCCNILNCFTLLSNDQTHISICNFHDADWIAEWACLSNVDAHLRLARVLIYDSFNRLLCKNVLFMVTLNEHVSKSLIFDFTFSNLNFSPAFVLQSPNSLTFFADDETDCVVWNRYDVG